MNRYLCSVFVVVLVSCKVTSPGALDNVQESSNKKVSCLSSVDTTFDPLKNIIYGNGKVTCDGLATLFLKVCLYSKNHDESLWGEPILCKNSSASSSMTINIETTTSTALNPASYDYQAKVEAQVNSIDLPSQASNIVTVFSKR